MEVDSELTCIGVLKLKLLETGNRNLLEQYAAEWIAGATNNPLPNPKEQCYFLATKLHPNVLSEVLQEDLTVYKWFPPQ